MKAIVVHEFGGPEFMHLEDVPDQKPGPSDVLVRVFAAGVNPVDAYIRSGTYPRRPTLPYVPGFDGAGIVESAGIQIKDFKTGDRVYVATDAQSAAGAGTYAEMALCASDQVHALPDHISFSQGAGVNIPYVTAWRALFTVGGLQGGETVTLNPVAVNDEPVVMRDGRRGANCVNDKTYSYPVSVGSLSLGDLRTPWTAQYDCFGELTVFSHHHAAFLYADFPWTDGNDVPSITLAAPVNVELTIRVVSGDPNDVGRATADVLLANKLFDDNRAGINLIWGTISRISPTSRPTSAS